MGLLKGFDAASSWLHLKSKSPVAQGFGVQETQSINRVVAVLIILLALALLSVCIAVFVLCFELWAVDSPVGFWIVPSLTVH